MEEKTTVLIVDDHPVVLKGLCTTIEETGEYRIVEAAGVDDALQAAREHQPTLAVIDIVLPDGDGIRLTRKLLELLPQIRVLIISMHSRRDYVVEAFRGGAMGYVVKESSAATFLAALSCVAKGNYFLDGNMPFGFGELLADGAETAGSDEERLYGTLSPREQEVMRHLVEGLSCRDIAQELDLSVKTVDNHRAKVLSKLDLSSTVDLVHFAVRLGLIEAKALSDPS